MKNLSGCRRRSQRVSQQLMRCRSPCGAWSIDPLFQERRTHSESESPICIFFKGNLSISDMNMLPKTYVSETIQNIFLMPFWRSTLSKNMLLEQGKAKMPWSFCGSNQGIGFYRVRPRAPGGSRERTPRCRGEQRWILCKCFQCEQWGHSRKMRKLS